VSSVNSRVHHALCPVEALHCTALQKRLFACCCMCYTCCDGHSVAYTACQRGKQHTSWAAYRPLAGWYELDWSHFQQSIQKL
jgi:hypothetical protein